MAAELDSVFLLKTTRMHEVCGAGSTVFALTMAAQAKGSILWIEPDWQGAALNPQGIAEFVDPKSILVAAAKNDTEILAVAEESLRSGAVPLVIFQIKDSLSLTAGRRLQLAAKAGKSTGLALISEGQGSNAAETRWRCTPVFDAEDSTLQSWELIKNKSGTLSVWHVRWNATTRRLHVVPAPSKRSGS